MNSFKRRKAVSSALAVFIAAAAFVGGFAASFTYDTAVMSKAEQPHNKAIEHENIGIDSKNISEEIPIDAASEEIKIVPGAEFVFITKYSLSQKNQSLRAAAPEDTIGMSFDALCEKYPLWEIESFETKEVRLVRTVNSYGPGTYTLMIEELEGQMRLVLYEHTAGEESYLKQVFDTPVELFDEQEYQKLCEGIVVLSEDALSEVLQNYAE